MTFDEQIKKTLKENSQWPGSSEQLWDKVSSQLEPRKRLWLRPPFWFGTAVAAMLLVAVLVKTVFSPLPPTLPEVEEMPRMQTFSAVMLPVEPISVQAEAELGLALDIYLVAEEEPEYAQLLVWQIDELEETLHTKIDLEADYLLEQGSLTVEVPRNAGTYRLVVQGVVQDQNQLYGIYAEQIIIVEGNENQ